MQSYCFFLDYANIWEENRVFLVLFRAKRGDCTQGCVYFVYLYTLGAKKAPAVMRGGKNTHYYICAQAREGIKREDG